MHWARSNPYTRSCLATLLLCAIIGARLAAAGGNNLAIKILALALCGALTVCVVGFIAGCAKGVMSPLRVITASWALCLLLVYLSNLIIDTAFSPPTESLGHETIIRAAAERAVKRLEREGRIRMDYSLESIECIEEDLAGGKRSIMMAPGSAARRRLSEPFHSYWKTELMLARSFEL